MAILATACVSESTPDEATTRTGPMADVEVVVGGTPDPTNRIMSALMAVALEQRGADVIDRSGTEGVALNRDDLVAGRLEIVPEDIGTGWFVHLGREEEFARTTELARQLRSADRENGIEWSDHSLFDDALAAIAEEDSVVDDDGDTISVLELAERLRNSFDAVVCVDQATLESPDGLVRFERATGFTVPAEQLEVRPSEDLVAEVDDGNCTVAFVPAVDPELRDRGLEVVNMFAPSGQPEVIFRPRNAAYMFDAEFYDEWNEWLAPFLESLMASLDAETMTGLKAELADGDTARDLARRHLERSDLL